MGRPIKAKYFGTPKGTGVGGESVLYANVWVAGSGYFAANAAITFSAPQITGGTTATGTVTVTNGNIAAITLTNTGSGYTSAPTASITGANTAPASANVTIGGVGVTANAMVATAYLSTADGGSSAVSSDIIKQVGARRYKVQNAQGTGKVKLVAAVPAAGEMTIIATDSAGGQYYVKKLESRTACLKPTTGLQFVEDQHVEWTFGTPTINLTVQIQNR